MDYAVSGTSIGLAVGPVSAASNANRYGLQQLRQQQARRNAEQAAAQLSQAIEQVSAPQRDYICRNCSANTRLTGRVSLRCFSRSVTRPVSSRTAAATSARLTTVPRWT